MMSSRTFIRRALYSSSIACVTLPLKPVRSDVPDSVSVRSFAFDLSSLESSLKPVSLNAF